MNTVQETARSNQLALRNNHYPGRGLILGTTEDSHYLVQVYWLMGRSQNSRNRRLKHDGQGRVYTEMTDGSVPENADLIIYNAMNEKNGMYVVSNGSQTDKILNFRGLEEGLLGFRFEPDSPTFTPRINGLFSIETSQLRAEIAIASRLIWGTGSDTCLKSYFKYSGGMQPGFGYCITTYAGDGNPPPSYSGAPYLLLLKGNILQIAQTFWDSLYPPNRVALAVKFINVHSGESAVKILPE